MLDNALIQAFLPIINAGLIAQSYSAEVVGADQPLQQGVNNAPTVYFYKYSDRAYGMPSKTEVWDAGSSTKIHTMTQVYETIFRFSALVRQDPTVIAYTASDLVKITSLILEDDASLQSLLTQGIQILKITELTNPYVVDDRGQHQASPTFDVIFTHQQSIVSTVAVIQSVHVGVYPI